MRIYLASMSNDFSEHYGDLLTGSYDCVDRIVLNAYFSLGHSPGGFRTWWRRWHGDSDEELDNTRLMRMAGRFSRRLRGWARAHGVPVIDCKAGERKHLIAEEYLATHSVGPGVFMVLVARAPATVWEVKRSRSGVIYNLEKKKSFVNHYSFHIMDPTWGRVTIKMSGHPPFGAQVILNGHEYVACSAQASGLGYAKEGNCLTAVADPESLAEVADTLSLPETIGRLSGVCDRSIYSACCVSDSTQTSNAEAGPSIATRSTRSSTAATCCSPRVRRWTGSSTPWSTGPVLASTCRGYAPSSGCNTVPTESRALTSHPARQS